MFDCLSELRKYAQARALIYNNERPTLLLQVGGAVIAIWKLLTSLKNFWKSNINF
jgi:hypothetical protein